MSDGKTGLSLVVANIYKDCRRNSWYKTENKSCSVRWICFDSQNLIGKRGDLLKQSYSVGGLHQWDIKCCLRWIWVSKHQRKPALKKKYEKKNSKIVVKKSSIIYSNPKSSLWMNENKALFVKLLPKYLRKADDNVNVCIEMQAHKLHTGTWSFAHHCRNIKVFTDATDALF